MASAPRGNNASINPASAHKTFEKLCAIPPSIVWKVWSRVFFSFFFPFFSYDEEGTRVSYVSLANAGMPTQSYVQRRLKWNCRSMEMEKNRQFLDRTINERPFISNACSMLVRSFESLEFSRNSSTIPLDCRCFRFFLSFRYTFSLFSSLPPLSFRCVLSSLDAFFFRNFDNSRSLCRTLFELNYRRRSILAQHSLTKIVTHARSHYSTISFIQFLLDRQANFSISITSH